MLPGLIGRDPWKPDEAYTFGIVNHIAQTGEWVAPQLAGEPFMEKPPLFFVTSAIFVRSLGSWLSPHDAARLATAFYVGLTLLFAGLAAGTLYGRSRALPCVVVLIGCIGYLHPAHLLFTDHAMLAGIALALYGLANILEHPWRGAVALGTGWVTARDHAAIMAVLPADHIITNRTAFQETLALAADAAQETSELVTIGITPTWACPGFGYIEHGKPVRLRKRPDSDAIHRVVRFREKPNLDLAESFLRKGNFRWNAGMFVWSVPTVLREFNRHASELADFISQVRAPENFEKALREQFSKLPRISFDYAIMEKADRVLVVEASFDWDDIGSWRTVANYFEKDQHGNAANRAITALDSSNNVVFEENGTTVALLGVHNLIVVRTEDALLICDRHEAERIKDLIGKIPPELQ